MSVSMDSAGQIRLSGVAPAEDAEPLLRLLLDYPLSTIDWRDCEVCHTAVLQVIMAARRDVTGPPAGDVLAKWFAKAL